jgi:hypothetical protein
MKHTEARPYAEPEAAARKLLELAAGVQAINGPFLSKDGCKASGPEFGPGIRYAIEKGWLDLHESGTYVLVLAPGAELFSRTGQS